MHLVALSCTVLGWATKRDILILEAILRQTKQTNETIRQEGRKEGRKEERSSLIEAKA